MFEIIQIKKHGTKRINWFKAKLVILLETAIKREIHLESRNLRGG